MNNYYNIKIPDYNLKYGDDWDLFKQYVDDQNDYVFKKTFELYYLNNIDRMPDRIVKIILDIMDVQYDESDTPATMKNKLRTLANKYINKGLDVIYIDVIEPVTSITPDFYLAAVESSFRWGVARWGHLRWTSDGAATFQVLIETYVTDDAILDEVQRLLQEKVLKPAFYQVYLLSNGIVTRSI